MCTFSMHAIYSCIDGFFFNPNSGKCQYWNVVSIFTQHRMNVTSSIGLLGQRVHLYSCDGTDANRRCSAWCQWSCRYWACWPSKICYVFMFSTGYLSGCSRLLLVSLLPFQWATWCIRMSTRTEFRSKNLRVLGHWTGLFVPWRLFQLTLSFLFRSIASMNQHGQRNWIWIRLLLTNTV